jgi:tetratricopeptide (TPR) repeat protein
MRTLVRIVLGRVILSSLGRWVLTIILLLFGLAGLLVYPDAPPDQATGDLVTGIVFMVLGLAMLVFTISLARLQKGRESRAKELLAAGKMLPIPALPPLPKGVTEDDVAPIAEYARSMAKLPWGEKPRIPASEVREVFDRTVARTRRVPGDWRMLGEPIDTFVAMPRPLCFVGAAEVMLRLSYLRGLQNAAVGLRQGLLFAFAAQLESPQQPDALIIQAKLLSGTTSKRWLELAEQTIAMLKQVAPTHPRLPDAEARLHEQRGEYEAALDCVNRTLAHPPSPEELEVALSRKGILLLDLERYSEAVDVYDEALARSPDDPWTWHNRSVVLMSLGRYDEALESNTRALSIMNFGAAHQIRDEILAKRAEASGTTPGF